MKSVLVKPTMNFGPFKTLLYPPFNEAKQKEIRKSMAMMKGTQAQLAYKVLGVVALVVVLVFWFKCGGHTGKTSEGSEL
jgi:hypothetical protein